MLPYNMERLLYSLLLLSSLAQHFVFFFVGAGLFRRRVALGDRLSPYCSVMGSADIRRVMVAMFCWLEGLEYIRRRASKGHFQSR